MATELSSEDIFTLTEIGYASVLCGTPVDVKPIFDALALLYPENTAGAIGHAVVLINRGDFDSAIELLQICLRECSTNTEEAKAVLTLAMHLRGPNDQAELLTHRIDDYSGIASTMAKSLVSETQQS